MSKIKLTGSNSGYVEIASAADAGNLTLTLPTGGTALLSNGNSVFTGITTFQNDLKLEGGSYDVLWDASDNQLEFDDNAKLSFGASSDLSIYHDSNHSRIVDTGTGNLKIQGSKVQLLNADNSKEYLHGLDGGGVTLRHNNNVKLVTESGGVTVTGILTATEINYTGSQNLSNRNMIINGDQRIAQRGTAAVTVTGTATYRCIDRFKTDIDGSLADGGQFSHAQDTDVPTGQGFKFSSKCAVVNQVTQPSSAGHLNQLYTMLEHQDVLHLEWGTANAKTVTLSFWVKSSVTGTYNLWMDYYVTSDQKRYNTTYTISSANTWEKKIITLTGPTSGGQSTRTDEAGFRLEWLLGASSAYETGTLDEWYDSTATFRTAAGSVYFNENAVGSTWYLTGVQFETGSVATPFEHRSFLDEYLRCCRYYFGGGRYGAGSAYYGAVYSSGNSMVHVPHPVPMRTNPTASQPTFGGGGSYSTVYENTNVTQYYITGDASVNVQPAEVDISAEL